MTLDAGKLEQEIFLRFQRGFGSLYDAAWNLARAYHAYASSAVDASGDTILGGQNLDGFASTMLVPTWSAADYSLRMTSAVSLYWQTVSFNIGTPPPPPSPPCSGTGVIAVEASSNVTSVIGPEIYSRIYTFVSRNGLSLKNKAREFADALHGATLAAVVVTISGTDAGGNPATHVCGVG